MLFLYVVHFVKVNRVGPVYGGLAVDKRHEATTKSTRMGGGVREI